MGGVKTLWRVLPEPALEPEAVLPHQQGAATELITFFGDIWHGHFDNLMASWSHGVNMPNDTHHHSTKI